MFKVEMFENVTVMTPTIEIDASNSLEVKSFFKRQLESGQLRIIVDLSRIRFLDSSALAALSSAAKAARSLGGAVRLCGLSPQLLQIFHLTRLDKVVDIYPDRDAALNA